MTRQEQLRPYHISTASRVSQVEAGFGLVHADTIVATIDDKLIVTPSSAHINIEVKGKATSGLLADLELKPGSYEASLQIIDNDTVVVSKQISLLLVEPSVLCRSFGARYGSLEYNLPVITGNNKTVTWKSLWKTGEVSDIIVDFEKPYKLVLWRGMSYTPSWMMNNLMTSLFFAETIETGVFRDCCEMMSDRECRYSHARIIHSHDARVVIHWRYALNDSAYTICRNQWVDEMYYIYPDGVACRNVTVYLDPNDEAVWQICPKTGQRIPCGMINSPAGKRTFNNMEFITVNAPGNSSEDNILLDALTLLDTTNFTKTFKWPDPIDLSKESFPELNEYIFRLNYKHSLGVFVASPNNNLRIVLVNNSGVKYEAGSLVQDDRFVNVQCIPSNFADYIHWPITRGYGTTPLTDRNTYNERPTHTFLGYAYNDPVVVRNDGAVTWSWLTGIAQEDEVELRARVKSWTSPTKIQGAQYNSIEGVYVVENVKDVVVMIVEANRPVIRPTFILSGCKSESISILINGSSINRDMVAVGVERSIKSVQTVVTLRQNIAPSSTIQIRM